MRMTLILLVALTMASCSPDTDSHSTESAEACSAKLYTQYNPNDIKQCVDVCIRCDKGVATTCSTSCTLKGAH